MSTYIEPTVKLRINDPYHPNVVQSPTRTTVPPGIRLPIPQNHDWPSSDRRKTIPPVWQLELMYFSQDHSKATTTELVESVQKAANFLRFQRPGAHEQSCEIGQKIYEKFWRLQPSSCEVRDFWIAYIQLMGLLSLDLNRLCDVYRQIIQDAFHLSFPIPWSVSLSMLHFLVLKDDQNRFVEFIAQLRRDFMVVLFNYSRFYFSPGYSDLVHPVIGDLRQFRTSFSISELESQQAQYLERLLRVHQVGVQTLSDREMS